MSDYTHYHFSEEENVTQHYDYPELDTHKSLHQDFINKLSTSTKLILAGDSTQGRQLRSFLLDWILNHILKSDKKNGFIY
ncbi:MAG: hemerythrin family protein [Spirochaetia bacterium]|nr:hemerythrin family protein [Spirochaetia bacterium]